MSFAFYCANKSIVLHYIPRDYGHLFAKKHLFISSGYSILFEVVCTLCACSPIFINQQNEVAHILWAIFICLIIILLAHRLILFVAYNPMAIFHKDIFTAMSSLLFSKIWYICVTYQFQWKRGFLIIDYHSIHIFIFYWWSQNICKFQSIRL